MDELTRLEQVNQISDWVNRELYLVENCTQICELLNAAQEKLAALKKAHDFPEHLQNSSIEHILVRPLDQLPKFGPVPERAGTLPISWDEDFILCFDGKRAFLVRRNGW